MQQILLMLFLGQEIFGLLVSSGCLFWHLCLSGQNVCTEIHFIRHAESTMNAKPELIVGRSPASPLTALGKRQARALGVHLRSSGMDFDAVYSSPLERAKQTAYTLCQVMDGIGIEHATIAPHVSLAFI